MPNNKGSGRAWNKAIENKKRTSVIRKDIKELVLERMNVKLKGEEYFRETGNEWLIYDYHGKVKGYLKSAVKGTVPPMER